MRVSRQNVTRDAFRPGFSSPSRTDPVPQLNSLFHTKVSGDNRRIFFAGQDERRSIFFFFFRSNLSEPIITAKTHFTKLFYAIGIAKKEREKKKLTGGRHRNEMFVFP